MGSERDKELVKKARSLRQQPIFDYIVDFYCHELMLIIEVDGEIHSLKEIRDYDKKREKILTINGYHLIRLSNLEIETETDSAITKIKSCIKMISSPFQVDYRGLKS
jgi:very-short-patch-repair endonuclease